MLQENYCHNRLAVLPVKGFWILVCRNENSRNNGRQEQRYSCELEINGRRVVTISLCSRSIIFNNLQLFGALNWQKKGSIHSVSIAKKVQQ